MVILIMRDKCGNWLISGEGHRMTYIGYNKKEAQQEFRKKFNLQHKHIEWIE